jgi:hypothetical protein
MRPAATPARAPTPQRAPMYTPVQPMYAPAAPQIASSPQALSSEDALLIINEARKPSPNIPSLIIHVSIGSSHIYELISQAKVGFIERAAMPRLIQKLKDYYKLMLEFGQ